VPLNVNPRAMGKEFAKKKINMMQSSVFGGTVPFSNRKTAKVSGSNNYLMNSDQDLDASYRTGSIAQSQTTMGDYLETGSL
jgi:hypothetical protein